MLNRFCPKQLSENPQDNQHDSLSLSQKTKKAEFNHSALLILLNVAEQTLDYALERITLENTTCKSLEVASSVKFKLALMCCK